MTQPRKGDVSDQGEPERLEVWPRTPTGYCSCPYCAAIRDGRLEIPETQSLWSQRMGARK